MADLTALTAPLAAAAALALVVTPHGCVAAHVAVTLHDVTVVPEAWVGTAGLLGAAMDHSGRVGGRVFEEAVQLAEGVCRGERAECRRLLLLLSALPRVSNLLGVSFVSPTEGILGAAAVLNPSAMGIGAWLERSASTPACACWDAEAAAVVVGLLKLMFFAGIEAGRKLLSNAGDAASRAGGVLGEPLLLPPPPLPPQLGLLLLRALRLKEGSCAWAVR